MKQIRKTNLFNIQDQNNLQQFITLSNYPDSMTATHLSVNAKLYPSAFIALYVPGLDTEYLKESGIKSVTDYNILLKEFIINVSAYYENKLAFMRDYAVSDNKDSITKYNMHLLTWLLDFIYKYDENTQIVYIADIVEQNHNGVWSDMFCTIDTSYCNYIYNIVRNGSTHIINYNDIGLEENHLYGWCDINKKYIGPSIYESVSPILDVDGENGGYDSENPISKITKTKADIDKIKFNIVIPLYNMYIDNPDSENSGSAFHIDNNDTDETVLDFNGLIKDATKHSLNDTYIPYGIWFSGVNSIILNKNNNNQSSAFAQPTWSLCLSSQFKAFPYTLKSDPSDKQIDSTGKKDHEKTFAEILSAQNNIMDRFHDYNKQLNLLQQEVMNLKSIINKMQ